MTSTRETAVIRTVETSSGATITSRVPDRPVPAAEVSVDPTDFKFASATTAQGVLAEIDAKTSELDVRKLQAEELRGFNAALAEVDTTPVDIVVLGDSAMQLVTTPHITRRLAARYNERKPGDGTQYHQPNVYWGAIPYGWDTQEGTSLTDKGLGAFAVELDNGEKVEHTVDCDGMTLMATKVPTGTSTIEVKLDDVSQGTIDLVDAGLSRETSSQIVWESGELTWGEHKLTVTCNGGAGTIAVVDGALWHYGTVDKGIRVWDGSHAGWTVALFEANPQEGLDAITELDPDLVIIEVAHNDYGDTAALATNYASLIDQIQAAAPDASILNLALYATLDRTDWGDYVEVIRDLAITKGCAFVDLEDWIGNVGAVGDIYDLSGDNVHPTTKGSVLMAEAICSVLMDERGVEIGPNLPAPGPITELATILGSRVLASEGYLRPKSPTSVPLTTDRNLVIDTDTDDNDIGCRLLNIGTGTTIRVTVPAGATDALSHQRIEFVALTDPIEVINGGGVLIYGTPSRAIDGTLVYRLDAGMVGAIERFTGADWWYFTGENADAQATIDALQDYTEIIDDFISAATGATPDGALGWSVLVSGTGAAITGAETTPIAGVPGHRTLSTGTTATGRAALRLNNTLDSAAEFTAEWRVRIPTSPTAGEDFALYVGLHDSNGSAAPTDGYYFARDRSISSNNWVIATADGGVRTTANSAVAATAGSWFRLRIRSDGTDVHFYINGTEVGTSPLSTNLPDASDHFGPGIAIGKVAGTTARTADADYAALRWAVSR